MIDWIVSFRAAQAPGRGDDLRVRRRLRLLFVDPARGRSLSGRRRHGIPGDHHRAGLGGRRSRAAGHHSARARAQRHARHDDDALALDLRPVADHACSSATASRTTGRASASWSGSQNVTLPPKLTPGLDPLSSPTGQILYYMLQIRHEESARTVGDRAMDGDPDLEAGAGRRRRLQLRRAHDAVSSSSSIRSSSCASILRSTTSPMRSAPTTPMPAAACSIAASSAT